MRRLALVAATAALAAGGSAVAHAVPAGCTQIVPKAAGMCDSRMVHPFLTHPNPTVNRPQHPSLSKPLNQGLSKTPSAGRTTPPHPAH